MSPNTHPTQRSKGVYQVVVTAAEAMVIDIEYFTGIFNESFCDLNSSM
jgi:hypothetical protein